MYNARNIELEVSKTATKRKNVSANGNPYL